MPRAGRAGGAIGDAELCPAVHAGRTQPRDRRGRAAAVRRWRVPELGHCADHCRSNRRGVNYRLRHPEEIVPHRPAGGPRGHLGGTRQSDYSALTWYRSRLQISSARDRTASGGIASVRPPAVNRIPINCGRSRSQQTQMCWQCGHQRAAIKRNLISLLPGHSTTNLTMQVSTCYRSILRRTSAITHSRADVLMQVIRRSGL